MARKTFDENAKKISELLSARLKRLGPICTNDAWNLCQNEFTYSTIAQHFSILMKKLEREYRSERAGRGKWLIKPLKK